jgi:nucleotide-binding universal stress UspA family protein
METYSRILVAYDHSEPSKRALQSAIKLASINPKIEIDVLNVIHVPAPIEYPYNIYMDFDDMKKICYDEAKKNLLEAEKLLNQIPNKTTTFILEGMAAQTIVEFAKEKDCDLIVMGCRGLSGLKELFLGSVSHNVLQHSPISVYIVK